MQGLGWFGEDGQILVTPDPLKDIPTRPQIINNDEREPGLQTVFTKVRFEDQGLLLTPALNPVY